MEHGVSSSQQRQAIKQFVDGETRLMNREDNRAAFSRQPANEISQKFGDLHLGIRTLS